MTGANAGGNAGYARPTTRPKCPSTLKTGMEAPEDEDPLSTTDAGHPNRERPEPEHGENAGDHGTPRMSGQQSSTAWGATPGRCRRKGRQKITMPSQIDASVEANISGLNNMSGCPQRGRPKRGTVPRQHCPCLQPEADAFMVRGWCCRCSLHFVEITDGQQWIFCNCNNDVHFAWLANRPRDEMAKHQRAGVPCHTAAPTRRSRPGRISAKTVKAGQENIEVMPQGQETRSSTEQ